MRKIMMGTKSQAVRNNATIVAILLVFLVFSIIYALSAGSTKNVTEMFITLSPSLQLGVGNITAKLTHSSLYQQGSTSEAVIDILGNKVDPKSLSAQETFAPIFNATVNITFQNEGGDQLRVTQICVNKTNTDGIVICKLNIAADSCGYIVAEFLETATDIGTFAKERYCVPRVPFAFTVDPTILMVMLFFGLLAAGVYASGRNPLSAFDITTPKVKGPYSYPSYMHKKAELLKGVGGKVGLTHSKLGFSKLVTNTGRRLAFNALLGNLGNLSKAGVLPQKEFQQVQRAISERPLDSQYVALTAFAVKKQHELIKQINFSQKQIDKLSIKGPRFRSRVTELEKAQGRLEEMQRRLASSLSIPMKSISTASFVPAAVDAKTAEIVSLMNKNGWSKDSSNWVDESKRLVRLGASSTDEAILIPFMDARLHIEDTRLRMVQRAIDEVEGRGDKKDKEKLNAALADLADIEKKEATAMHNLLSVLHSVNGGLSTQLQDTYDASVQDSKYLGSYEDALYYLLNERENTDNKDKLNKYEHAIEKMLFNGYDAAIDVIARESAAVSKLPSLESAWKKNIPPDSVQAMSVRFGAFTEPEKNSDFEGKYSGVISTALDSLEHLNLINRRINKVRTVNKKHFEFLSETRSVEDISSEFIESIHKDLELDLKNKAIKNPKARELLDRMSIEDERGGPGSMIDSS